MMTEPMAFADRAALAAWLDANHAGARELWVRLHKAGSGTSSVAWEDCVVAAIAVGWIDAVKRAEGPTTWLQRLVPRRRGSSWSARNRAHAERLIAEGRMQAAGLAQVEAAVASGRWEAAYAGQRDMTIPADFLAALEARPAARDGFAGIGRQDLYAIYYRLHTARTPATREKRMERLLAALERGDAL